MDTIQKSKSAQLIELRDKNKLIAEFMGATWEEFHDERFSWFFKESPTKHASVWHDSHALLYHEEFSWLMPVVEKIEDTEQTNGGVFSVRIEDNECRIIELFPSSPSMLRMQRESTSKITAVWLAVVNFIEWYNTQNNL